MKKDAAQHFDGQGRVENYLKRPAQDQQCTREKEDKSFKVEKFNGIAASFVIFHTTSSAFYSKTKAKPHDVYVCILKLCVVK